MEKGTVVRRYAMKKLFSICIATTLILAFIGYANAEWYVFEFSEEDLWFHTPSSDTRLYNQDAPRRHHTQWKADVQTTDSTQGYVNLYQGTAGTNGWYQTDTYDNWLGAGPEDNSSNPFGITEVQLWGAGWPNVLLTWNERYRVNAGSAAWMILATPSGWTGSIAENPWPDNNTGALDQYWAVWSADSYNQRILFNSAGDGKDEYLFRFAVDIYGEYPTALEPTQDDNPFETNGSLRVWFGGNVLDETDEWTNEGFDGIMELSPLNLGQCLSSQIKDNCSGLKGNDRKLCNQEQIGICQKLFNVTSAHNRPTINP
jgi:hypothetical protein